MDADIERLRALILADGYEIAFRDETWTECLVSGHGESWLGRGTTAERALREVARQMFPSHSSRTLLDQALAARTRASPQESPALDVAAFVAPPPEVAVSGQAGVAPPAVTGRVADATPAGAVVAPQLVEEPKAEQRLPSANRRQTAGAPEPPTSSVARLEKILADIESSQPVVACLAPERQRLWLLIWICRARAQQELHPSSREVHDAVARIARRLGEMAKTFWPGSVRALQATAIPADAIPAKRGSVAVPQTWAEAAVVAERTLDEHLVQAERANLDEDGWADAARLEPRPHDADAVFGDAASEIQAGLDSLTPERIADLGRIVRWTRRAVSDPVRWGTAMGRLRQSGTERCSALREICDSRFTPKLPWARTISSTAGVRAPAAAKTSTPTPSLAPLPGTEKGTTALAAWLVDAFVLDTPALIALVAGRKEEVCAMDDSALPSADRRLRRRFRELKRRLADGGATPVDAPPEVETAGEPDDEPAGALRMLEGLAAAVRAHTIGRTALFVSNRHDPPLQAKLEEVLGLSITWCDATPRRVQSLADRVARGGFDMVLSATGFQVHAVDSLLSKAAKSSRVPLVRVDRGRPVACIRAIARELGIAAAESAGG